MKNTIKRKESNLLLSYQVGHRSNLQIAFLTIVCVCLFLFTMVKANGQQANWDVRQISNTAWNTPDGLPYSQVPGANLGATSFEVMDGNRIAFLCNSTSEIFIIDKISGKVISKFTVSFAPRDFIYDQGLFYVLTEYQVTVFQAGGSIVNQISFSRNFEGVERLTRFDNATYLLLPSGNSLMIESNGTLVPETEYEGWITQSGYFVKTQINGDNTFAVNVITQDGKRFEKVFSAEKKVAGIFVIGASSTRLVLDLQTFVSESPISVDRNLISVEYNPEGIGNVVSNIKVPLCYYVLSNKEFDLAQDGSVINMVTAPEGAYVFSLKEAKSSISQGYPSLIATKKYHFNDHLIETEK